MDGDIEGGISKGRNNGDGRFSGWREGRRERLMEGCMETEGCGGINEGRMRLVVEGEMDGRMNVRDRVRD